MARRVSLFSFIVTFVVSIFCLVQSPAYATPYTDNGSSIDWSIDDDGTLTIAPISGNEGAFKFYGSPGNIPWGSVKSSIVHVRVPSNCRIFLSGSIAHMFDGCRSLVDIDLTRFDFSGATNMSSMFRYCDKLTSLDLSNFDTRNVTNMSDMFSTCRSLTSLDVSGFDTSKVTNMDGMFEYCSALTSLDVSGFDTHNVTKMSDMFCGCSVLTGVDMSGFDMSKVTIVYRMFCGCPRLNSLDLSNLNMGRVTTFDSMLAGCSSLTSIDLFGIDTSSVESFYNMFNGCSSLTSIDLSDLDTSTVTNMGSMFVNCSGLTSLDVSVLDMSNVTDFSSMFSGCSALTSLDFSDVDTGKAVTMASMFKQCSSLSHLDVSGLDTSNVTDMGSMFEGCKSLTQLDVTKFNTSNVTNMTRLFSGCSGLTSLDVSHFDVRKVTRLERTFSGCSGLTSLDVSHFDTSAVTDVIDMFYGCSSIRQLDLSGFNFGNVTSSYYFASAFGNCPSLSSVILGENTRFLGASSNIGAVLPTPPYSTLRKWVNMKDPDRLLTSEELRDQYDASDESMIGEWIWAYARTVINFYPNGSIGSMTPVIINGSDTGVIPDCNFSYFDHDFQTWSTSADGNGTEYPVGREVRGTVNKNVTINLYAIWSKRDHTRNVVDGGFDVTIPAGCRLVVNGLPAGTSYVITESDLKGWNAVDVDGASGMIPAADVSESVFVNQYSPNVATARIVGTKTLDGRPGEGFVFELCEGNNVVSTAMSDASGAVMFDAITYDVAGVHDYVVREVPVGASDVTYDDSEYPVRVTVTDNDGTLSASVSYPDGNVSFANETIPGRLSLRKLTQGGGDASSDDSFTFTIRFTNGYGSTLQDVLMRKQVMFN